MQKHVDPVCGKRMNPNKAHVIITYQDEKIYLCCPLCQKEFEQHPDKYVKKD